MTTKQRVKFLEGSVKFYNTLLKILLRDGIQPMNKEVFNWEINRLNPVWRPEEEVEPNDENEESEDSTEEVREYNDYDK